MIIITYICIIVYCMVENVNVINDRLKSLAPCPRWYFKIYSQAYIHKHVNSTTKQATA